MNIIKTIFFDWGGVLINDPANEIVSYCSKKLDVSSEIFLIVQNKYLPEFQIGKISENNYWQKICADLNVPIPQTQSLWGEAFRSAYSPKEDMLNLVAILKSKGIITSIISNTEIPCYEFYKELNYVNFDVVIFSCLEKTRKPEEKIYKIALEKTHTKCFEGIFIDDKMENIKAAQNLHLNVIYYKNFVDTVENLKKYSILF